MMMNRIIHRVVVVKKAMLSSKGSTSSLFRYQPTFRNNNKVYRPSVHDFSTTAATTASNTTTHNNTTTNHNKQQQKQQQKYIQGPETHFGFESVGVEEKEGRVRQVFESVADSYDVMNDLMSGGLHRYWKDTLLDMSAVPSMARALRQLSNNNNNNRDDYPAQKQQELRILDVAGGTGDVAFRFVEAAGLPEQARSSATAKDSPPEITVTVCDINKEMLRVGEARARERYGSRLLEGGDQAPLSFVQGNAQDLQFADNSFDLYTIAFGLRNVTDVVSNNYKYDCVCFIVFQP
jgi:ubiquinone/menaquinone biosynthesis C-methylase UbiE